MDYDAFAELQVRAGFALVESSGLVARAAAGARLVAQSEQTFEGAASIGYERLKSWLLFLVGTEYMLKGLCAFHGVPDAHGKTEETYLRNDTLGAYWKGSLPRLAQLPPDLGLDSSSLVAACERLAAIRNRDVHLFVLNVRQKSFPALDEAILPMLNQLVDSVAPSSQTGQEIARFFG